jgi:glycosyltransferase involved in cell wall biosynthesis
VKPRRLLILTNGHLCRNPRVVKEATTLGCAGHDVTVLGVRNYPPAEAHDTSITSGAPFRWESINLLPRQGAASFLTRLRLRCWREVAARLGQPTVHALGPATSLLARARAIPADLTIAHNEIAHWTGLRLRQEGRRVAADIEDWHSEDLLPGDRRSRPLELLRRLERDLLGRCLYTTTTSEALAQALHARYGGLRPAVITNAFPLQAAPRPGRPAGDRPPRFFWYSQTLGPGRGLEAFVRAWALTRQASGLVLLGEDRHGFRSLLLELVPSSRRAAVEFLPVCPPESLPAEIARHDLGLALEDRTIPSRDLTITNKILQYLNAGLMVVATPTAGQREVLSRQPAAGRLLDFGEPAAAAHLLDGLLSDPANLARSQSAARTLAEDTYCWEKESPRLLRLVQESLPPAGPAPAAPTVNSSA